MAYDPGLIFDNMGIKLGQRFDEVSVILLMRGLEISLFTDFPIYLYIANRIKAFQHGLVLGGAGRKKLLV
jgi:hypothetical protein